MSHWHWDVQDRQTLAITGLFSIQAVRCQLWLERSSEAIAAGLFEALLSEC